MKIVFDIGGSIICPDGVPDLKYVNEFSRFLIKLKRKKHRIIVVTGGGGISKNYIEAARTFKPSEDFLDAIGIMGTRMNAMILIASLGKNAYPRVVKNKEDLGHGLKSGKIVVMGGTIPKQTTDAVTIAAAGIMGADLVVIGTDVKGIYDKDPDRCKSAKMFNSIKIRELEKLTGVKKHVAKPATVMDPVAVRLLKKLKIRAVVLKGTNLKNVENLIDGRKFTGTVIR